MITADTLELLKTTRNLLAFSAGVDSSALFFILLESEVEFDVAIVDYNQRSSSKDEVAYADSLASKHGKKIFKLSVNLEGSDFENSARRVRYEFFEQIIKQEGFTALLTAHQLNDRLEWLLMRLTAGAGVNSLSGMREIDERDSYLIVRPLLQATRDEISKYLTDNNIVFFEDESNADEKYSRNAFRHRYSNELVTNHSKGIKRSFSILEQEAEALYDKKMTLWIEEMGVAHFSNDLQLSYYLDSMSKKLGYLLSYEQKNGFLAKKSAVFGDKISAEAKNGLLYVAPHKKQPLQKEFKEKCRLCGLPPKTRGYVATLSMSPFDISKLIDSFFTL